MINSNFNFNVHKDWKNNLGYHVVLTLYSLNSCYYACNSDNEWISFLGCDRQIYFDALQKFNIYNHCTREFPVIFFKTEPDAWRALHEFYEPQVMMKILAESN